MAVGNEVGEVGLQEGDVRVSPLVLPMRPDVGATDRIFESARAEG
jgi:hypothetical protein